MRSPPISKTKLESKLAIIREALLELAKLAALSKTQFIADKRNFAIAEHYLRRALEAIFDTASHVISRYPYAPGKRPATFKELAIALGDRKIIEKNFAKDTLVKMAGYRNRMVHFYSEVTPDEVYELITTKRTDIEQFGQSIVTLIKNPKKFNLELND